MKAKEVKKGDVFADEDGKRFTVIEAKQTRAFRMSLAGHKEAYAIMISYRPGREWTLAHPEEDIGTPVRQAAR